MTWWTDCEFPPISRATPEIDWATQALAHRAIKNTGPGISPGYVFTAGRITKDDYIKVIAHVREMLHAAKMNPKVYYQVFGIEDLEVPQDMLLCYDDGVVNFDYNPEADYLSFSISALKTPLFDEIAKYVDGHLKAAPEGRAFVIVSTAHGPTLKSVGVAAVPFEEGNYNQDVVEKFEHVVKDLRSNDPCGRIILFDGEPGTGKTFLVRALTGLVPNATFAVIPSEMVEGLVSPSLITSLLGKREEIGDDGPIVLVIEDADGCLVPRGSDNMGAISTLLNMSDGILGSMLDLRIVATTNAGHLKSNDAIDEAIMRPGRLCSRIHVDKLGAGRAEAAYTRLTGKDRNFPKATSVAEVYRLARDGGYVPPQKDRILGFKKSPEETPTSSPGEIFDRLFGK
jgi:energy-coupling factor transporter ATP-binding protein EcfA2